MLWIIIRLLCALPSILVVLLLSLLSCFLLMFYNIISKDPAEEDWQKLKNLFKGFINTTWTFIKCGSK